SHDQARTRLRDRLPRELHVADRLQRQPVRQGRRGRDRHARPGCNAHRPVPDLEPTPGDRPMIGARDLAVPARAPRFAPRRTPSLGLYLVLLAAAVFYVIPVYLLLMTGMKSFAEASNQALMWQLPKAANFGSFEEAWRTISPNFINSVK